MEKRKHSLVTSVLIALLVLSAIMEAGILFGLPGAFTIALLVVVVKVLILRKQVVS